MQLGNFFAVLLLFWSIGLPLEFCRGCYRHKKLPANPCEFSGKKALLSFLFALRWLVLAASFKYLARSGYVCVVLLKSSPMFVIVARQDLARPVFN